jgi:hypothetical protein
MKLYKKSALFLLAILLVAAGCYVFVHKNSTVINPSVAGVAVENKTTLIVAIGSEVQNYDISKYAGKTVLEATREATGGNLITSGAGENAFVTAIAGRQADAAKHEFWELLVNGEQSQVGAGSYIIKDGDQIKWQISTY